MMQVEVIRRDADITTGAIPVVGVVAAGLALHLFLICNNWKPLNYTRISLLTPEEKKRVLCV